MKKHLTIFILFLVILSLSTSVNAGDWSVYRANFEKDMHRISKDVPREVKQIVVEEYNSAQFKPFGIIGGILKGLFSIPIVLNEGA